MHSLAVLLYKQNMHLLDTVHVCCAPCSMALRQQALYPLVMLLSVRSLHYLHICSAVFMLLPASNGPILIDLSAV